jgi:cytochrome c553
MSGGVWRKVLATIAGLALVAGLAGFIASSAGLVLTSARPPHSALTTLVLHYTFKQSVARGASGVVVPAGLDLADPGLIRLGAEHFANTCASCHGGPGLGQSPLALSMRPSPQHLPAVVGQFSDAELFWIVREGVRFSPMPAWPAEGNFDEIWSVVAFLRQLPDMTADDFAALRTGTVGGVPVTPWGSTGPLSAVSLGVPSQPVAEYAYNAPTPGWTPLGLDERPLARCVACHGVDGSGAPTGGRAPNLTILSADDIATALRAYAEGRRESGIMAVVASALSGDQIAALGTYFADSLPDVASPPSPEGNAARGAELANLGKPEAGVPACLSCHADAERERIPLIRPPGLAGQSQRYLKARLDAFSEAHATGLRQAGWHPMPGLAAGLTADERADVAAYFAGLLPGGAPAPRPAPAPSGTDALAVDLVTRICSTCHKPTLAGDAKAAIPNLTGQSPEYIALQLWAFHAERRTASQMIQTAGRLTGADIAALAAHIGAMAPIPAPDGSVLSTEDRAVAERIAREGDAARGVPACASCHSPDGRAALALVPRLDGQGAAYLERRLAAFAERRDAAPYSPMPLIASSLTLAEQKALAALYASR